MKLYIIGSLGQWAGLLAISVGVAIELRLGADIGFLIITAGTAVYAIATKCVECYWRREARRREKSKS